MPNGLSFIGPPEAPVRGTTQVTADPGVALIEQLLERLEVPLPEPPTVGGARGFFGTLGDAITRAGLIRGGIAPPPIGQFAATTLQRQQDFERRSADAIAANRDLERTIRFGIFKSGQEEKREERRIKFGIAKEKRVLKAVIAAEERSAEARLRETLISEAFGRGVDFGDLDLQEASTQQIQEKLEDHDQFAVLQAFEKAFPDRQIGDVAMTATGRLTFSSRPKDEEEGGLNLSQAMFLARNKVDPSSQIKDQGVAEMFRSTVRNMQKEDVKNNAAEFYRQEQEASFNFSTKQVPSKDGSKLIIVKDPVNVAMESVYGDLIFHLQAGSTEAEVAKWYEGELQEAADALRKGEFTSDEATEFIVTLRKAIRVRWPDIVFPEIPQQTTLPLAPQPTAAISPQQIIANAELNKLREKRDVLLEELKNLPRGPAGTKSSNARHGPLKKEISDTEARIRKLNSQIRTGL